MDLGSMFARTIVDTNYDRLPDEVVEASKMAILDTLGCMLAGSGAGEGVEGVVGLLDTLGGAGTCTVVGFGKRGNEVLAAMANGSLAHSIDYDDAHDDAFVHPSASVVPAALTVGESMSASGKDLIAAVAVGNDLICRLGFAVSNPQENEGLLWMLPVLLGTFSATAASAKLLGLNAEETENALGIAYNRAGGTKELVIESGALRGLYGMFPNMTGVLSALLAKNGVPGLKETFGGKAGFFSVYYDGVFDQSAFADMGERFEGAGELPKSRRAVAVVRDRRPAFGFSSGQAPQGAAARFRHRPGNERCFACSRRYPRANAEDSRARISRERCPVFVLPCSGRASRSQPELVRAGEHRDGRDDCFRRRS